MSHVKRCGIDLRLNTTLAFQAPQGAGRGCFRTVTFPFRALPLSLLNANQLLKVEQEIFRVQIKKIHYANFRADPMPKTRVHIKPPARYDQHPWPPSRFLAASEALLPPVQQ